MKTSNTLLKKILILFAVLLVPLIVLISLALNYTSQVLKKQLLSSIDANNSTYISQLDNTMYTIYSTNYNIVNQPSFHTFSNTYPFLSTYEKGYRTKLLREQISSICTSSSFIRSAHIYFKNLKIIYNSSGYELGSFSSLSENGIDYLKQLEEEPGSLHYYYNPLTDRWELSYLLLPSLYHDYGAIFVLSTSEIENYLRTNVAYEGEHYLISLGGKYTISDLSAGTDEKLPALQEQKGSVFPTALDGLDYYAFCYDMPHTSSFYVRLIPAEALLHNTNIVSLLTVLFLLLLSFVCIAYFTGVYRLIHKPLRQLTGAFAEVESGNFKAEITDFTSADFAYLYQAFNDMTRKLDKLIEKDYAQKLLLQKAELKQLQAQINPHFLYNSFFMLHRMIKMECTEDALEMANALGIYFRYLTRNSMEQVTLLEEYEHAKTYAYIQGLRFTGRIRIEFDEIPPDFVELPVPKLILQPILENAFNYGLSDKIADGLLQIRFAADGDTLSIFIEENGNSLSDEKLEHLIQKLETARNASAGLEMSGILNIQRRLAIFSNSHDSLHLSRSPLGGLCVTITLQKSLKGDN